jgi:hypothetical protein
MPRKKAAEPAANDGDETLTHPLFPHVPTAKIVGLVVKRLVVERRKGYPGHGAGDPPRVNLTPQAVPPSVIVGDETLAKDYGPGVYEVHAIGAGGRFAAGVPYRTKIPDETGHVPMYVDEFEDAPEDGDGVGGGVAVGAADAALTMMQHFLFHPEDDAERFVGGLGADRKAAYYRGLLSYAFLSHVSEEYARGFCGKLDYDASLCASVLRTVER